MPPCFSRFAFRPRHLRQPQHQHRSWHHQCHRHRASHSRVASSMSSGTRARLAPAAASILPARRQQFQGQHCRHHLHNTNAGALPAPRAPSLEPAALTRRAGLSNERSAPLVAATLPSLPRRRRAPAIAGIDAATTPTVVAAGTYARCPNSASPMTHDAVPTTHAAWAAPWSSFLPRHQARCFTLFPARQQPAACLVTNGSRFFLCSALGNSATRQLGTRS